MSRIKKFAWNKLDTELEVLFQTTNTLRLPELQQRWAALVDFISPERLEHYLEAKSKKVCPGCSEFLRKHLSRSVAVQYVDYELATA